MEKIIYVNIIFVNIIFYYLFCVRILLDIQIIIVFSLDVKSTTSRCDHSGQHSTTLKSAALLIAVIFAATRRDGGEIALLSFSRTLRVADRSPPSSRDRRLHLTFAASGFLIVHLPLLPLPIFLLEDRINSILIEH